MKNQMEELAKLLEGQVLTKDETLEAENLARAHGLVFAYTCQEMHSGHPFLRMRGAALRLINPYHGEHINYNQNGFSQSRELKEVLFIKHDKKCVLTHNIQTYKNFNYSYETYTPSSKSFSPKIKIKQAVGIIFKLDSFFIMANSPEAAKFVTDISGWVDRHGFFFGKDGEDQARYAGSTHRLCQSCDTAIGKHVTICTSCSEASKNKKYQALKKEKWHGEMLFSEACEEYFSDECYIRDHLVEHGGTLEDMRLYFCEQNPWRELEDDFFEDDLAEDCFVPQAIQDAIEQFNKAVKQVPTETWWPSAKAADLSHIEILTDAALEAEREDA